MYDLLMKSSVWYGKLLEPFTNYKMSYHIYINKAATNTWVFCGLFSGPKTERTITTIEQQEEVEVEDVEIREKRDNEVNRIDVRVNMSFKCWWITRQRFESLPLTLCAHNHRKQNKIRYLKVIFQSFFSLSLTCRYAHRLLFIDILFILSSAERERENERRREKKSKWRKIGSNLSYISCSKHKEESGEKGRAQKEKRIERITIRWKLKEIESWFES